MSAADPLETMRQIYLEGDRSVPYPVFLKCFNDLIEDSRTLEPKPPSDELKDTFRAVCMAVNVGIKDELNRGEKRKQEFYERIYKDWKQALGEEEFEEFEKILDGTYREQQRAQLKEAEEKPEHLQQAEDALDEALKEIRGGQTTEAAAPEQSPESEEETAEEQNEGTDLAAFSKPKALINEVARGDLPVNYVDRKQKTPFAAFRFHGKPTYVRLIRTESERFVTLVFPLSGLQPEFSEKNAHQFLLERDYERAPERDAFIKEKGKFRVQVKIGKNNLVLALRHPAELDSGGLARALDKLCSELQMILKNAVGP